MVIVCGDQVGALLVLLRQRGETATEIAGMVRALQKACHKVKVRRGWW
jgi:anthranilate phosphoribosyltransferase